MSNWKTDELTPCQCGFKPDHFSIFYGQTPFDVFCPDCMKQLARAKCKCTGHQDNAIDYWNKHLAALTKEQLTKEYEDFKKEQELNLVDGCRIYSYYWEKGEGEILIKRG